MTRDEMIMRLIVAGCYLRCTSNSGITTRLTVRVCHGRRWLSVAEGRLITALSFREQQWPEVDWSHAADMPIAYLAHAVGVFTGVQP